MRRFRAFILPRSSFTGLSPLRVVLVVLVVTAAGGALPACLGDLVGDGLRPLVDALARQRETHVPERRLPHHPRRHPLAPCGAFQQVLERDFSNPAFALLVVIVEEVFGVPAEREQLSYLLDLLFGVGFESSLMTSMISEAIRPSSVHGATSRFW